MATKCVTHDPSLALSLWKNAHWTWRHRKTAKRLGFPFSEETITETVLLHIATNNPTSVSVVPFNKRQEAKIGADWEWCFYNSARTKFLPMLIQAKVLDIHDYEYAHLDHKSRTSGVKQIDRLIDSARRKGVIALYAFYNHLNDPKRLNLAACACNSCKECWGCTVALAEAVNRFMPDKTFDTLSKISMPWLCLICDRSGDLTQPSIDHVHTALRTLKNITADATEVHREAINILIPEIQSSPPSYFNVVQELREMQVGIRRDEVVERLTAENADVDGIVLVKCKD